MVNLNAFDILKAKKARNISFLCVLISLIVFACATIVYARSSPASFKLRQAYLDYPALTLYADLRDAGGRNISYEEGDNIAVSVGNTPAQVGQISSFSSSKDGIAFVFLVDISKSIRPPRFEELRNALSAFIRQMGANDKAAIISFGNNVNVIQEFTSEPKQLLYSLQALSPSASYTQLNSALIKGMDLARIKSAELPKRRMIILCSDGFDDSPDGASPDDVRESIKSDVAPIYAVFFDSEQVSAAGRRQALDIIGEFSRRTGGTLYDIRRTPFRNVFSAIKNSIDGSLIIDVDLKGVSADGRVNRVSVSFSNTAVNFSEAVDVALPKIDAKQDVQGGDFASKIKALPTYQKAAAGVIILLIVAATIFVLIQRNKKAKLKKKEEEEKKAAASVIDAPTTVAISNDKTQRFQAPIAPAAPKGPVIDIELTVTGSSSDNKTYAAAVSERLTIGRNAGPSCLAIAGDGTISSKHCELVFSNGKLFVSDLKSTNGTMLNGVLVGSSTPIKEGDRLTIGKTELRIRIKAVR